MTIEPIAFFQSPLKGKFGAPRQSSLAPSLRGNVVMTPEYKDFEALRGLEQFDFIWLVWGFSANVNAGKHPTVRPPRLGGNARVGVFASRSPFRPNNLGLSAVRLEKVSPGMLTVRGADLIDGTPIYDIKPYIPSADSHPEARAGFVDLNPWKPLEACIPDHLSERLLKAGGEEALEAIREILSQDPRPHYHSDPSRIYGFSFGNLNIRFRVEEGRAVVIEIS